MRTFASLIVIALVVVAAPTQADPPAVRIGVLKFGTVTWLTDTIEAHDLDGAQGYRLETVELAARAATTIAFQARDVDVIVADWVWALQQRGRGEDLRFAPYSRALGALMTDGTVDGLCDLRGRPVGVVGGDRDKNWLVLQALVRAECGFDLAAETQTVVGAAPLMSQQLIDGSVDAISTYWNHAAKLEAQGMIRLIGVEDAMERIGIVPAPALIGFVWDAGAVEPEVMGAFRRSIAAAQDLLAADDAEWERLRPRLGAESDAEFTFLRDYFRAGIARGWRPEDTEAAAALHRLLVETGGDAFEAEAGSFDPALFAAGGNDG
jgi:NitT/TauT family transport system substrate-binding protein